MTRKPTLKLTLKNLIDTPEGQDAFRNEFDERIRLERFVAWPEAAKAPIWSAVFVSVVISCLFAGGLFTVLELQLSKSVAVTIQAEKPVAAQETLPDVVLPPHTTPNIIPNQDQVVRQPAPDPPPHIRMRLESKCWISVDDGSAYSIEGTFKAGYEVEDIKLPVHVRTGCPGKVSYFVDEVKVYPPNLSQKPDKSEVVELP